MSYASTSKAQDNVKNRGDKGPSPAGTATFLGLRLADIPLQYGILRLGWADQLITRLGGTVLPQDAVVALTNTPLDALELSPYRLILLAMATGSTVKQIYWLTALSYERLPPSTATFVASFATTANTLNHLLFLNRATSASVNGEGFPQTPLLVGMVLYATGMLIECTAETQRYLFKKDPKNKGKVYTGGLFGVARHINYMGFLLWKTGYAVAAGGYTWGLVNAAMLGYNFTRCIPPLAHYCQERYGEQWEQYTRQTPYKMCPGIY